MVDVATIPRVILVFNGPLEMSEGKIAAQAFQACDRLREAAVGEVGSDAQVLGELLSVWKEHTTTIARKAKTSHIFERVCAEVPGVPMIDEGYTEVPAGSVTCWVSWPMLLADLPRILSNGKVPLL